MPWTVETFAGHRLDRYSLTSARHLLIYLPDARADVEKLQVTAILEAAGITCICPAGNESLWSNRCCPNFDSTQTAERYLLTQLLPWLRTFWHQPIAIAGSGMGGQAALRLAFQYPEHFPVVAGLNAAIDCYELFGESTVLDSLYDSREQCRQDSVTLHIHPVRQPVQIWFGADQSNRWFRGNDRFHEKLSALGVAHRFETADVNYPAMFRFLEAAWKEQSRRLL